MPSSTPIESALPSSAKARAWAALRQAKTGDSSADVSVARDELQAGDICVFPGAEVDGVWWLILSHSKATVSWVPLDACPLLGPEDRGLEIGALGGEHSLRLGFGVELEEYPDAFRVASLSDEERRLVEQGLELEGRAVLDEEIPALQDWLQEGPERARRRLQEAAQTMESAEVGGDSEGARPWVWPALAAVLVSALLGVSLRLQTLDQTVERLSRSVVNVPYEEVKFNLQPRGPGRWSVPENADWLQIDFVLPADVGFERFRIVLFDAEGRELDRTREQEASTEVNWLLRVDPLPEPPWEFHLQVPDGAGWKTLDRETVEKQKTNRP